MLQRKKRVRRWPDVGLLAQVGTVRLVGAWYWEACDDVLSYIWMALGSDGPESCIHASNFGLHIMVLETITVII